MKALPFLALLLALVSWVLMALTGINTLSGHFDERTCQTACVQTYFFSAVATGGIGLLLALVALVRSDFRIVTYSALIVALPLCAVFAGLILIGNFGNALHSV
jgi:hypothetical protein